MSAQNEQVRIFGPFTLDLLKRTVFRGGRDLRLRPQAVALVETLTAHPNEILSIDEILNEAWGIDANVMPGTVKETMGDVRDAFEEYAVCFRAIRGVGYRFEYELLKRIAEENRQAAQEVRRRPSKLPNFKVDPQIKEMLSQQRMDILQVIDQYIELQTDVRGWQRNEVEFHNAGPYRPSADFERFMERFNAQPPIREYYSLCEIESRVSDEERKLVVSALGGDWRHAYTLNEIVKHLDDDSSCRAFRKQCEKEFMPSRSSSVYRNINCEMVLVSSDDQVVLARRRLKTAGGKAAVFAGMWTASLEEQMLRRDPEGNINPDIDLFACAERGVTEELRVSIRPEATRLLSYGIEWGNFTAAFMLLVRTVEGFEAIAKNWQRAEDRNEAIALDCIPANSRAIRKALGSEYHQPSKRARTWKGGDSIAKDRWHPTARARLSLYFEHLEYSSSLKS